MKVVHFIYVLKNGHDEKKDVQREKGRFFFCTDEKDTNDNISLSPMPDFTAIKIVMYLAKRSGRYDSTSGSESHF